MAKATVRAVVWGIISNMWVLHRGMGEGRLRTTGGSFTLLYAKAGMQWTQEVRYIWVTNNDQLQRCGSKFGIYLCQDIMRSLSSTVGCVTSISSVRPSLTPIPNISSFILLLVNECILLQAFLKQLKKKNNQQIKYFTEENAQAQNLCGLIHLCV